MNLVVFCQVFLIHGRLKINTGLFILPVPLLSALPGNLRFSRL